MDATEMKRWLASVARLTTVQKVELLSALGGRDHETAVGQLRIVFSNAPSFPMAPRTRRPTGMSWSLEVVGIGRELLSVQSAGSPN
jgi:hypothetical protein